METNDRYLSVQYGSRTADSISQLPAEIISAIASYLDSRSLWNLCFANRAFCECCLFEIHSRWYASRMTIFSGLPRIKWLMMKRRGIWRGICAAAFACLYQNEFAAGAIRMFKLDESVLAGLLEGCDDENDDIHFTFIDDPAEMNGGVIRSSSASHTAYPNTDMPPLIPSDDRTHPDLVVKDLGPDSSQPILFSSFHDTNKPDTTTLNPQIEESTYYTRKSSFDGFKALGKMQTKYPNPQCEAWRKAICCTMDFRESFFDPPNESMGPVMDVFFRYSERMDIGSFLIWIPSPTGNLLFRLKPTGKGTKESPFGKPGLVLWDSAAFGYCNFCHLKLERIQVCGSCRVFQYCSREW